MPPLVAVALGALVPAPESQAGPRLLLVQPAIPQERKSGVRSVPRENFAELREWTRRGVEALEEAPDLVCWGETMLYVDQYEPELREAFAEGLEVDAWWEGFGPAYMDTMDRINAAWIEGALFGRYLQYVFPGPPVLPPGTSFLAGHIHYGLQDGRMRRFNAISLWGADAVRSRAVGKTRLVPGAETLYGFENFPAVRDFVRGVANYVPDLAAFERPGSLGLETRAGEHYRIGASVCFDNAFLEPYTELVAREEVDFFLVVSNEAWYRESWELDQMMAFSRLIAISTGRAVVRATNSGVSAAVGPDGRELLRLEVDGRDRMVGGTLPVVVPVPAERRGGAGIEAAVGGGRTPFLRLAWLWRGLALLLGPLGWLAARGTAGSSNSAGYPERNPG